LEYGTLYRVHIDVTIRANVAGYTVLTAISARQLPWGKATRLAFLKRENYQPLSLLAKD
jgi:hypothetical protein